MKGLAEPTNPGAITCILVLAGPPPKPNAKDHAGERHAEMHNLLDTAGREVVATSEQHLHKPVGGTHLGTGKIAELRAMVKFHRPEEVVLDVSLSPRQQRNLERELEVTVVDYDELILNIFARNARTHQAMLAVELARMEYTRGRLQRMWTHLDRQRIGSNQGGGSGFMAGTGEKQIEMDRRQLKERIQDLKDRLNNISERTDRAVATRSDAFSVALVGYTNAGKSTVMNALTSAGVLAENRLFATLDTRTSRLPLERFHHATLSDTVGFIRNLPHQLIASFHATLAEVREADLLLHIVDCASPVMADQVTAVEAVLATIDASAVPVIMVFNKIDAAYSRTILSSYKRRYPNSVTISALTGEGLPELRAAIEDVIAAKTKKIQVRFPARDGALNAWIRSKVTVLDEDWTAVNATLTIESDPVLADILRAKGAEIIEPSDKPARKAAKPAAAKAKPKATVTTAAKPKPKAKVATKAKPKTTAKAAAKPRSR